MTANFYKNKLIKVLAVWVCLLNTLAGYGQVAINKAEYFIDTDPGFGLANDIPVNAAANIADKSFTIPLNAVADGFHNLFVRSRDANGVWSISNKLSFFKVNITAGVLPNINKAEYFIDTDPGFGLANDILVSAAANISDKSFTIPLNAVVDGFHNLFVRSRDANGVWSISNKLSFFKVNTTSGILPNINKAEYFIDSDPGFGLANDIPVNAAANIADKSFTIPLNAVADGFHNLFVRSRNTNGVWSVSNKLSFFRTSSATLPNIVKAEYFIDVDPGFGLAGNVPLTASANISNLTFNASLTGITAGFHQFYLRSLDANGVWSITNTDTFTISSTLIPSVTIGNVVTSFCAGSIIRLPFTVNTPFGTSNTFTAQLSDANGNFTTPVNIGTFNGNNSDSITCTIPANTAAGSNYRIRSTSTSPIATSPISGDQLTVKRIPERAYVINGATNTCIGVQPYIASVTESDASYLWQIASGGVLAPTAATASINWSTAGNHSITITASNSCGNGESKTLAVWIFAGIPAFTPSITISNRTLTAALAGTAQGVAAYQWYKDGISITNQTNQSYTAPDNETGSYTVAYSNSCGKGDQSAATLISIVRNNQTITFSPVATQTFGDASFQVAALASSGLPVIYTIVSGAGTINGDIVTISGGGIITVRAYQEGNASFNTAEAFLNITINKLAAIVALNNMVKTYNGNAQTATATTTPSGLGVSITYNGTGNLPVNAGSYATSATINSTNYQGSKDSVLLINKASQTVTLQNIPNKSFNDAAFSVTALANSGLPVSLAITTLPATGVATINGNVITIIGVGSVTVTATQAGNQNYTAATAATSFAIIPPVGKDVEVVSVISPANNCELGSTSTISIKIRNSGTSPVSNFPVSYSINGDAAVSEIITASIASGSDFLYTFTGVGSFASAGQTYQLQLVATLDGDERTGNDTLTKSVTRFANVVSGVSNDTTICAGGTAILKAFGGSAYNWTNGPATATYSVKPAITSTYQVTISNSNGCGSSTTIVTVNVTALPAVNAGNDTAILRGSSVTLTGTGDGSLSWSAGSIGSTTIVSPQVTTAYQITATAATGCKSSDAVTVNVNFSALNVVPAVTKFGSVVKDSTAIKSIVITNTGTLPETINNITGLSTPFTTNFSLPVTLPAGTSVAIPVSFTPTDLLFYQNIFALATTAGNFNITLQGKGVDAAPAWQVQPASYDFGRLERNTTVSRNFTIKNTGNVPIRISLLSSSNPRFVATTNGNNAIPVGGSIAMTIRFNPTAIDIYNGFITLRSSTANLSFNRVIVAGEGYVNGTPPHLQFITASPYNSTGGVFPEVGTPGTYTYSVLYRHPDSIAPRAGFPKIGIDKNNDGDCFDPGEGIYSMINTSNSQTWISGVTYYFTTNLAVNNTYGYQFFATDLLGNTATNTEYKKGPVVTRETLDLHIFASDIVFSKPNPNVNETFTATATVHNNSPYAAANIEVRWYYKDSISFSKDTIPFIDAKSTVSITKPMAFSPDGFYAIKVWIDSLRTLGEGNVLNNYASRPVIVGVFTVPGTIDIEANAAPSTCNKGKTNFFGTAKYRGLNLTGRPPVEGGTVTLTIYAPDEQKFILNTDITGGWFYRWDPCALDANPECEGPVCGIPYTYKVEVTDYTLTSPELQSAFTVPCSNCNRETTIQHDGGVSACILANEPYTHTVSITNFIYDGQNKKICAPTVYKDTIEVYQNGQLKATHVLDSIKTCDEVYFTDNMAGLPAGQQTMSFTHTYYSAVNVRQEVSIITNFEVLPAVTDLTLQGIDKTGLKSFSFADVNLTCGVAAGPHVVYLYDSVSGYASKLLIDSFVVKNIPSPFGKIYLSYNNPDWQIGMHYLTIITDFGDAVTELREDNNILLAQFYVKEPDIILKSIITSSTALSAGSLVNFTAKVFNTGSPVTEPFKVSFKVNGVQVGTKINVPFMNTGDTVIIVSAPYTIPVNPCPVEVTAFADVELQIQEFREDNNADTMQLGVNINAGRNCDNDEIDPIGAGFFNEDDATGTSQCTPYTALKGVNTYFATTVRNNGNRDAKNIKVQFKLNGQVLGTDNIASLKAGAFVASGFYYTFETVGRFIVNAVSDYTREICEIKENDNIGNIHIDTRPTLGDLQILSQFIAPSNLNPDPGQTITIVSSILNIGDAPVAPTKVRFFVDNVQLGSDILIDTLFAGQDTTVMATATYSSSIVGLKIVEVRADAEQLQPERTEGNNEATRGIIVGAAPDFANSVHEAITLTPATFRLGDSVIICNYIRNFGGDAGTAWMRFYFRRLDGQKILIDSVPFTMNDNDSFRVCKKWLVTEPAGQMITEIDHSSPPEFNALNNIDSLPFGTVVPLTLLSFNGNVQDKYAQLKWKTTAEINLSHFELERSSDGRNFNKLYSIRANNQSSENTYSYTDSSFAELAVSNAWYRLKMNDLNGDYRYSNIVILRKFKTADVVSIYPNPAKNTLYIQIDAANKGNYNIQLLDAAGKKLAQKQTQIQLGLQSIPVDVSRYAKGFYLLLLQNDKGENIQVKFVKE